MCEMSTWRSILAIATFFHTALSQSYHPTPTREDCADGFCLVLFRTETGRNWMHAFDDCFSGELDLEMVVITNQTVQDRVRQLLESSGVSDKVWIAGKQSSDASYAYVDGATVDSGIVITQQPDANCIYSKCEDPVNKYTLDNCAEENSHFRVVCQKTSDYYSDDGPYNLLAGDYSYRVVDTEHNWFSARNLCVEDGGDLIHTTIEDDTLKADICAKISTKMYWFGLRRNRWMWQLRDQETEDMSYYNWETRTDRPDYTDRCAAIHAGSYKWIPQHCDDSSNVHYFMCSNGTTGTPTSTSTPTSATPTSTTGTTTPQTTSNNTPARNPSVATTTSPTATSTPSTLSSIVAAETTGDDQGEPSVPFPLYYIAVIGVAAILIIVIPVVIVVCRRQEQKRKRDQTGAFPHVENGSNSNERADINAELPDPGYSSADMSEDAIAPYGEYKPPEMATTNRGNSDDVIAPYGEYRAETSAPKSKPNKLGGKKPDKPSKKPKAGRKPEKKDKQVIMDSESGEVPHVMTDEGNMYAVSLNDKRLMEENTPEVDHITTEAGDLYAMPMKNPK